VLDLNRILLFIACVSPLVLLAQTWRRGGLDRGWRLAAFTVLIVTGLAWLWEPETAGFVGGGAWVVLLLVPAICLRKTVELAALERFSAAQRLARALRFLHPDDNLRKQADLLRALALAQAGDFPSALALLASLGSNHTIVGRQAIAQSFRIRGDWAGLRSWAYRELSPAIVQEDFSLLPLYLRSLGETALRDELVLEFSRRLLGPAAAHQPAGSYYSGLLAVLALCGRVSALMKLLQGKLRKLPRDRKEFWIGAAEIAAGEMDSGRARLEKLRRDTPDHLLRAEIAQHLAHAGEMQVGSISPGGAGLLRRIEDSQRASGRVFASETARPTPAVLIFIALNVAMFIAEMSLGGSTDLLTLHRLGQLEISAVRFEGEYWRLVTALFLHYGPLHLLFNMYALFVIGPGLEEAIGSIRFGICYLLAGLGSGLGVLLLRVCGLSGVDQLVGASGCVMGLVGVWAGLLFRHRHAPLAGRRLKNIFVIVAVQTAFDLSTPQISMTAHMSGLLTGVALGLFFAPRRSHHL
jgi:rhomboid protease GluP